MKYKNYVYFLNYEYYKIISSNWHLTLKEVITVKVDLLDKNLILQDTNKKINYSKYLFVKIASYIIKFYMPILLNGIKTIFFLNYGQLLKVFIYIYFFTNIKINFLNIMNLHKYLLFEKKKKLLYLLLNI